jgi:hypothetical protein
LPSFAGSSKTCFATPPHTEQAVFRPAHLWVSLPAPLALQTGQGALTPSCFRLFLRRKLWLDLCFKLRLGDGSEDRHCPRHSVADGGRHCNRGALCLDRALLHRR